MYQFVKTEVRHTKEVLFNRSHNDESFLNICATMFKRVENESTEIDKFFHGANDHWLRGKVINGEKKIFPVAKLLTDEFMSVVVPDLRKRMDQVAWDVRRGMHETWKTDGPEWIQIRSFYKGLSLCVNLERLGLREIHLCLQPVDFSWRQTQRKGPLATTVISRPSMILPLSQVMHWSLSVRNYDESVQTWELTVHNGETAFEKRSTAQTAPADGKLVGYTSLDDEQISEFGILIPSPHVDHD